MFQHRRFCSFLFLGKRDFVVVVEIFWQSTPNTAPETSRTIEIKSIFVFHDSYKGMCCVCKYLQHNIILDLRMEKWKVSIIFLFVYYVDIFETDMQTQNIHCSLTIKSWQLLLVYGATIKIHAIQIWTKKVSVPYIFFSFCLITEWFPVNDKLQS